MTEIDWATADIKRSKVDGTVLTVEVDALDPWAAAHMDSEWDEITERNGWDLAFSVAPGEPATVSIAGDKLLTVNPTELGTALANLVNHAIRHAELLADEWQTRATAYRARLTSWT